MVALPVKPEQGIADLIYSALEAKAAERGRWLGRLGASGIAGPCLRRTAYDWWGAAGPGVAQGRMQRLFKTGHLQEARVIDDLILIGYEVWPVNPETGKQFTWVHPSGHYVVKIDGVVRGVLSAEKTPHLLEIKTHNDKNWQLLNKEGLEAFPEHLIQCHEGMRANKLTRALYVGLNKNDERYYFERVRKDPKPGEWVERRLTSLVNSNLTPAPLSDTQSAPDCFFCPYKGEPGRSMCAGTAPLDKNCRTCRHGSPAEDGEWACDLLEKFLTQEEQQATCGEHYEPKG